MSKDRTYREVKMMSWDKCPNCKGYGGFGGAANLDRTGYNRRTELCSCVVFACVVGELPPIEKDSDTLTKAAKACGFEVAEEKFGNRLTLHVYKTRARRPIQSFNFDLATETITEFHKDLFEIFLLGLNVIKTQQTSVGD